MTRRPHARKQTTEVELSSMQARGAGENWMFGGPVAPVEDWMYGAGEDWMHGGPVVPVKIGSFGGPWCR